MANWLTSPRKFVSDLSDGRLTHSVLRKAPNGAMTLRAEAQSGSKVIVKIWPLATSKTMRRAMMGRRPATLEYRSLRLLNAHGIASPEAIDHLAPVMFRGRVSEAVILADLGACTPLSRVIHLRLESWVSDGGKRLTDKLIQLTAQMVTLGIRDNDHRLRNFLVTPDLELVRIDLENAIVSRSARHDSRLGDMIGVLIATYVWHTRSIPELAIEFRSALKGAIALSARTQSAMERRIDEELRSLSRKESAPFNSATLDRIV